MHPDVEELRPKLKEILYDCAVEIRATKAALFLADTPGHFELVTEFGFRGAIRETADVNDPIVDRCGRGRSAFFVNGLAAEPRFSEILFESSTDRLLVAPLYARGKLIGLIDMRDKGGKQPFEKPDLEKAQAIAERLVELFANKNIFGHRVITLSNVAQETAPQEREAERPAMAGTRAVPPAVPPPLEAPPLAPATAAAPPLRTRSARSTGRPEGPGLATLVLDARNAASRIVAPVPETIHESEVTAVREALRSVLLIPGAVIAMFSAFGHLGGLQEIAGRSGVTEEAQRMVQSKLNVWLSRRGEGGGYVRVSVSTPFGTVTPPLAAGQVQKVFTAPLKVADLKGLYLTVVFEGNPERAAHELLGVLHSHLQLVIESAIERRKGAELRVRTAEMLVEPDLSRFPELRRHSEAVAELAESLARYLALSPAEVENARIVGLVHDCGMRLLDYSRLYRKHDLTQEELGFLREHPAVSASLVEPLLGSEIARAVLCHHERVDGRGYPNQLQGDEIPLLSRIVQICDAWVAMTDAETYQPPQAPANALSVILQAAGSQFDAGLASRFNEMIRARG
ncbi:MAG TPA: HD domain-containing phosphohydrolase [Thermoanaerobaculia bacterium]